MRLRASQRLAERHILCVQLRAAHRRLGLAGPAQAASSGDALLLSRLCAAEAFFRLRLALWELDFSNGQSLPELHGELLAVLRALRNWQHLLHRLLRRRPHFLHPQSVTQGLCEWPFDLSDPGHYLALLQLLALCRLFGQHQALARLSLGLRQQAGMDGLLARLLGLPGTWPRPPEPFDQLLNIPLGPGDATHLAESLARYLSARMPERAGSCFEVMALLPRGLGAELKCRLPSLPWRLLHAAHAAPRSDSGLYRSWLKLRPLADTSHIRKSAKSRQQARRHAWRCSMATVMCLAVSQHQQAVAEAPALPINAGYENWVERGLASWYGPGFQDRATANGERFDMHGLTAAHRSLPLPSFVLVRNLRNQRQVVVAVNDRGPFIDGRILDLSYAAARQLGMVEPGVVDVEIRRLSEDQLLRMQDAPTRVSLSNPMGANTLPVPMPQSLPDVAHLGGLGQLVQTSGRLEMPGAQASPVAEMGQPPALALNHLGGLAGFNESSASPRHADAAAPPQLLAQNLPSVEPRLMPASFELPAHAAPMDLAVPSHVLLGLHSTEAPSSAAAPPGHLQALRSYAPGLLGLLGGGARPLTAKDAGPASMPGARSFRTVALDLPLPILDTQAELSEPPQALPLVEEAPSSAQTLLKTWPEVDAPSRLLAEPAQDLPLLSPPADTRPLPLSSAWPALTEVRALDDLPEPGVLADVAYRLPRPLPAKPLPAPRKLATRAEGQVKQTPKVERVIEAAPVVAARPAPEAPKPVLAKVEAPAKTGLVDTLVKLTQKGWQGLASLLGFESKRDKV
ncbi:septal ring lytic transglycosylase RlpA family protein [Roseateles koreensis]|nr:septal ring lytic transglycosylase RlpA family protein [Roseateles koreensis]